MKSANVTVRVEPDVKEKAEAILSELGIPTSTAINMFYRQIVPVSYTHLTLPTT